MTKLSPADAARLAATDTASLRRVLTGGYAIELRPALSEALDALDAAQAELARLRAPTGDAMETVNQIAGEYIRNGCVVGPYEEFITRLAAAITAAEAHGRQAEREACARIVDEHAAISDAMGHPVAAETIRGIAKSIRSRLPNIQEGERQAGVREGIAAEIVDICATYEKQNQKGYVDTPGGLEHMGDVWRLLFRWRDDLIANPSEWRAMNTAPKDGSCVLLHVNWEPLTVVGFWGAPTDKLTEDQEVTWRVKWDDHKISDGYDEPTHWAPLPRDLLPAALKEGEPSA